MINLSKKAASKFKYKWIELPEQSGDFWKIDVIMVSHYPVLLIVHEYTLFTLVRRKSNFKDINSLVKEIRKCCPWYRYVGNVLIGKNNNKKMIGNINEMKRASAGDYSSNFCAEIESIINENLYSNLSDKKYGYGTPKETVDKYTKGQWPLNCR